MNVDQLLERIRVSIFVLLTCFYLAYLAGRVEFEETLITLIWGIGTMYVLKGEME